jgi:osmotically inducible protein OsmC
VVSLGIEPKSRASEAPILSVVLRDPVPGCKSSYKSCRGQTCARYFGWLRHNPTAQKSVSIIKTRQFSFYMDSTKKTLYTADATAIGGRSGHVRSTTGIIDLDMSVPEGLGGKKGATNPEELFAAGYSSCFQQALLVIAQRAGDKLDPATEVKCSVTLFQEGEGYGLSAILDVDLKSFDRTKTIEMVRQAHKICPYSVGTRGNMEVELKVQGETVPVQPEENAGVAEGK